MKIYVWKHGDSPESIARKKQVDVNDLLTANSHLGSGEKWVPGVKIRIPEPLLSVKADDDTEADAHSGTERECERQSVHCPWCHRASDWWTPYYEYQRKWLERLREQVYHERRLEHDHKEDGAEHDRDRKYDRDRDQEHDHDHDHDRDREQHKPKTKRKTTKQRIHRPKKKRVSDPQPQSGQRDHCDDEPHLPWLNL